jgi:uncharacterized protein (DUF58 family)
MFHQRTISILIFVLVAALLFRNGPLALLCTLIVLTAGLATLWSRWSLRRLHYARELSQTGAFPGDELTLTIALSNRKLLPLASLRVIEQFPQALEVLDTRTLPSGASNVHLLQRSTTMRWYEQVIWRYQLRCLRRGAYRIGPVQLLSGDPFGIHQHDEQRELFTNLLVYPQPLPLAELNLPARHPLGEARGGRLLYDPLKVVGVREYAPGDPLRTIHWAATARTGQLQTRIYERTTSRTLALFLDLDTFEYYYEGIDPELVERMISAVATLAQRGLELGYAVGLYVNGAPMEQERLTRLPPGRSPAQLGYVMETLARLTAYSVTPMVRLLQRSGNDLPVGTTLLLVGSVNSEAMRAALLRLQAQGREVSWLFMGRGALPNIQGVSVFRVTSDK